VVVLNDPEILEVEDPRDVSPEAGDALAAL
jgi:hypothetical protein